MIRIFSVYFSETPYNKILDFLFNDHLKKFTMNDLIYNSGCSYCIAYKYVKKLINNNKLLVLSIDKQRNGYLRKVYQLNVKDREIKDYYNIYKYLKDKNKDETYTKFI